MTHRVQLVELHRTSRWDKISPRLLMHNYETIRSHEWISSLGHEPVIVSSACAHIMVLSLLHVASVCIVQVFFALKHVLATRPLVSAHLKNHVHKMRVACTRVARGLSSPTTLGRRTKETPHRLTSDGRYGNATEIINTIDLVTRTY